MGNTLGAASYLQIIAPELTYFVRTSPLFPLASWFFNICAYSILTSSKASFWGMIFITGNNGLVRTKYITFGIEADNIREAKPRLERIEAALTDS